MVVFSFKAYGIHMARSIRNWNTLTHRPTWSKLVRLCYTESHIAANESARDPTVQKNESAVPKTRIKNELSYRLPTVSLPPRLADSVKEVMKRERTIRVVMIHNCTMTFNYYYRLL